MSQQDDVQRSLGRIESLLQSVSARVDELRHDFGDHKNDDQTSFSSVRALVYTQRDEIKESFAQQLQDINTSRSAAAEVQNEKLDTLKQDADRAKGAGWVILGLLGALATFVGGAVIAALTGVVKFH